MVPGKIFPNFISMNFYYMYSAIMDMVFYLNGPEFPSPTGADPGIYVSGGALDRRGVWGPPRSPTYIK